MGNLYNSNGAFLQNSLAVGGVIALDASTGMVSHVSNSLCQSLGYKREEINGIYWKYLIENRPVNDANPDNTNAAFLLDRSGKKIPCFVLSKYKEKKERVFIWNTVFYEIKPEEQEKPEGDENRIFSVLLHDLKSPIDQIEALCNLQSMYAEDPEWVRETNKMILASTEVAKSLVKNMSAFVLQELNIDAQEEIVLEKVTEEVIGEFRYKISDKKINLLADVNPNLKINGNTFILRTIIRNLLHNAVKFSFIGGEIRIDARQKDKEICLSIADRGAGIPNDILPIIFDLTKVKKRKGTSDEAGSGLGLYFCKKLAERVSIRLEAESSQRGTTFFVGIPL
jgi:signal transduction histidine kinase